MRPELSNSSTPELKLSKLLDIGRKACYAALGLELRTDIDRGPHIFVEPAAQGVYRIMTNQLTDHGLPP
jgi:hypothetical protein